MQPTGFDGHENISTWVWGVSAAIIAATSKVPLSVMGTPTTRAPAAIGYMKGNPKDGTTVTTSSSWSKNTRLMTLSKSSEPLPNTN
ncbi:hypothetical protein D9M71_808410 [compost metagenome]